MINSKTVEEKKVTSKQNPTDTSAPGPIIIAPHIESMEVTIVMGDQRSSYMNFNGGEAYVDDPYDDSRFGEDGFKDDGLDESSSNDDGIATVQDEIDHSCCAECEYTDCAEHPQSREAQKLKDEAQQPREWQKQNSTRQPMDDQQPNSARRPKDGTLAQNHQQSSKFKVTEGDVAFDSLPDPFKFILELLKAVGMDVEVKKYEEREDQSDE